MSELYDCAGTQFDPDLVNRFGAMLSGDQSQLQASVTRRWLSELDSSQANKYWRIGQPAPSLRSTASTDLMFHGRLFDNMHDGVVFVDQSLKVVGWNRAAERLTGIAADGVIDRKWEPGLVDMCDERGFTIDTEDCPVAYTIKTGVQLMRRLSIRGRGNQEVSVDAHAVPVVSGDGVKHGATLLLHDASSQISLEERVQSLHEKATKDPLTKVCNRAEFDRVLPEFVDTHLDRNTPCALIITDIDHFKKINDNYGHQAGDEALISFAALLSRSTRTGDMAARYGGEEFVILCADCDNSTGTRRADDIRRELAELPQPSLGGKTITASFGVTEVQQGDTAETMLRRADRALLEAKAAIWWCS